ncbi:hypothetical protein [Methylobacter tundripaludum]|uniref:hypothetical protein n=1 Tax=Methylobacter tundripaludum TaxID=173365 RepID=UPI000485B2EE|nr:hypothetical protein [Methylobacter tundripaludum]
MVSTKQVALVARWNNKVADAATKLIAFSCFDNNRFVNGQNAIEDDCLSFETLNLELTVEVIDVFHEYCYFLRKLIERTDQVDAAKALMPHGETNNVAINKGGMDEKEVELCNKSLWWVISRVIHSRSVMVLGGEKSNLIVYADGKTREYEDGRCYVEVSSDFDAPDVSHVIHIPSIVRAYTFSNVGYAIKDAAREHSL